MLPKSSRGTNYRSATTVMCARAPAAPSCSGFTIGQIGGIMGCMDLFFHKVIHPQARDNYRVLFKDDGVEIEVGSIGIQHGSGTAEGWVWGIDNIVPMREADSHGTGSDRKDCMKQFPKGLGPVQRRPSPLDRISRNEARAASMSWSRYFGEPIELPDGRKLRTLKDAIAWLAKGSPCQEC